MSLLAPVVLFSVLLCGCASTPEVTLLAGKRSTEGERDFAVTILVLQKFGEEGHVVGGCVHQSEPQNGGPFNHNAETTFDSCGLGVRFGGK